MLQQLQQYLRSAASLGRTTDQVGPFLVTINEGTDHPFLNYAIPDDGAHPTPVQVAALACAMRTQERIPRLEFLESTAPCALEALEAGGFAVERRCQAMVATVAGNCTLPPGYALVVPDTDAARVAMLAAQNVAYGAAADVDAAQLGRSWELEAAGGIVVAICAAGGEVVGGGVATPSEGSGFTEVAGIAVAEDHRRRGLATALAAEITRRALSAGVGTAFITPADDDVARLYVRAGYEQIGVMLHVRLE